MIINYTYSLKYYNVLHFPSILTTLAIDRGTNFPVIIFSYLIIIKPS